MKNLNTKKLYALLFISGLFIAAAKAQIVYTDINPDSTVTTGSSNAIKTYGLDLNNDGTVDFNILTRHYFNYAPTFYVMVTPLNTNEVLDSLSGIAYYLGLNSYIGTNLLWRNDSIHTLRVERGTNWWSGFWSYNTDAFLGLKVIVGSDTTYGWVRLSIQKNSSAISFTIKDYAYNSIPNQPILAGQTGSVTPINENFVEKLEHLAVFPNPANNLVTIKFPFNNDENTEPADVQIINLIGEIIFSEKNIPIANGGEQSQIDVSKFSAGMYLVRCNSGENSETKTFSIVK